MARCACAESDASLILNSCFASFFATRAQLLSATDGDDLDLSQVTDKSPYTILFGPDKYFCYMRYATPWGISDMLGLDVLTSNVAMWWPPHGCLRCASNVAICYPMGHVWLRCVTTTYGALTFSLRVAPTACAIHSKSPSKSDSCAAAH